MSLTFHCVMWQKKKVRVEVDKIKALLRKKVGKNYKEATRENVKSKLGIKLSGGRLPWKAVLASMEATGDDHYVKYISNILKSLTPWTDWLP